LNTLTTILWHNHSGLAETKLFGRPLWHWTLETVRRLEPRQIYLVSGDRHDIDGVQAIKPNRVASVLRRLNGNVLLLPAEAPCIQTRTLKRLLNASRTRPRYLAPSEAQDPKRSSIVCAAADDIQSVLTRLKLKHGIGSFAEALEASPIQSVSAEELTEVCTIADWVNAAHILRRRKCEKLIASGVFIEDPSTVHIDPDVKVGRGSHIHGWVVIEGTSQVGRNCDIGSFTHIVDTEVGSGTVLLDHCFIRSSRIGRNAQLGPFTHLRPDSVVGTKAKVGNFVELKKTVLGYGSKAPHLTYLGDAQVGRGVNVGAGTITCNYDGSRKHLTIIEDGAFIGSDVQLVAPVRVGRGAYVAAGSCITKDVPAGSLAVARGRQVVKAGWVRKKKATARKNRSNQAANKRA
jgi:bifunctional N-acetylglucosamine-1-phosphate-uridyltransferase/glucosamine-1-phosphate-acetyltransferase GlmU-like protein